jgi:Secretion system C-terminal sorting domain
MQAAKVESAMQAAKTHLIVYPNSAKNTVKVTYNCNTNGVFTLYNQMGQVVYTTPLNVDLRTIQINTANFGNGLYTYKATFTGCETVNGKLVILK